MKILFSTKTWEGDWKKILSGGFERKLEACDFAFNETLLVVNNTKQPRDLFDDVADNVLFVEDEAKKTLDFFGLQEASFKGGYVYSIAELAELRYAHAEGFDYLVHYSSDALSVKGDWISEGIKILEEQRDVWVVSPYSDVNEWHDETNRDQMFSDQCYLVRPKDFILEDYTLTDPELPEYPAHGGDSFERKMARILHKNKKYRYILTDYRYEHPAF